MTNKPILDQTSHLEQRVSILETELSEIKLMLAKSSQLKSPWWLKVAGSFEQDRKASTRFYVCRLSKLG